MKNSSLKRKSDPLEKRKGKDKETFESTSKPVTEKEASEFLKFIKHSEYNVIKQLNKTPARISLLSLFQNSEVHREVLSKTLGEAYVNPTITIDGNDQLVGNITASACIAFTNEAIPLKGQYRRPILSGLFCFNFSFLLDFGPVHVKV